MVRLRSGLRSGLPRAKNEIPNDWKKLGSLIPVPALALTVVASLPPRSRQAAAARDEGARVDRIEVELVAQRVTGAQLLGDGVSRAAQPAAEHERPSLDGGVEVRPPERGLPRSAGRRGRAPGHQGGRGAVAQP